MCTWTRVNKRLRRESGGQTIVNVKKSQKVHLLTFKCYRFRIGHFWQDYFCTKFLNGSLEPVLAGFGIKVALG